MKQRLVPLLVLATFLLPGAAVADSIFVGSDQGIDFTVQHSESSGVHNVSLLLNTAGYTGTGDHLHAISLKLFSSLDLSNISVVDLPGLDSNWTLSLGQVHGNTTLAKGNQLGNGNGFFSEVFTGDAGGPSVPGGPLSFSWTFEGQGLQFQSQPIFKAIFVDGDYKKSGDITEVALQQSTAPVPEPTSLSLLGTGMVGIAAITRRRNNRRRRNRSAQQSSQS